MYLDAANIAFQRKDVEALHYIQSKCAGQREAVDRINGLIARLANPSAADYSPILNSPRH